MIAAALAAVRVSGEAPERALPAGPAPARLSAVAPPYLAVVGASEASDRERSWASDVGRLVAAAGAVLVCGGLGGVMEAACRGALEAGGVTLGLLPGSDRAAANPYLTIAVATGLGELRNGLVVRAADAVIGIGGGWGTLSELALARRSGAPTFLLGSWAGASDASGARHDLGQPVQTPEEAVREALTACHRA